MCMGTPDVPSAPKPPQTPKAADTTVKRAREEAKRRGGLSVRGNTLLTQGLGQPTPQTGTATLLGSTGRQAAGG